MQHPDTLIDESGSEWGRNIGGQLVRLSSELGAEVPCGRNNLAGGLLDSCLFYDMIKHSRITV
jgi:hypothetical protein